MVSLPRIDLLRRGHPPNTNDVERDGAHGEREMQERSSPGGARLFPISRPSLRVPALFGRRGTDSRPRPQGTSGEEVESPKTPRFTLGLPTLPSTRLHLPHLARTWTSGSNGPASRPPTARPATARGPEPARPVYFPANPSATSIVTEPAPVAQPEENRRIATPRRIDGADPAEQHLADLAETGRRRTRARRRDDDVETSRRTQKRFLFCFPWIRSRRIRTQILRCFVSGLFLTLLLAVYLALSITKNINNNEFTVLLILIILFATIFFCHGLIRLCMLVVRPRPEGSRSRMGHMIEPGGYAVPRQPIRVVLARDEEAAGIETDATKNKPPAYGLWRESVRVDPNRLFWQRNEETPEGESSARPSESRSGARPPSYSSDDGVRYVVEAAPRSIAPATDVPLPIHPSEAGRWDGRFAPMAPNVQRGL